MDASARRLLHDRLWPPVLTAADRLREKRIATATSLLGKESWCGGHVYTFWARRRKRFLEAEERLAQERNGPGACVTPTPRKKAARAQPPSADAPVVAAPSPPPAMKDAWRAILVVVGTQVSQSRDWAVREYARSRGIRFVTVGSMRGQAACKPATKRDRMLRDPRLDAPDVHDITVGGLDADQALLAVMRPLMETGLPCELVVGCVVRYRTGKFCSARAVVGMFCCSRAHVFCCSQGTTGRTSAEADACSRGRRQPRKPSLTCWESWCAWTGSVHCASPWCAT